MFDERSAALLGRRLDRVGVSALLRGSRVISECSSRSIGERGDRRNGQWGASGVDRPDSQTEHVIDVRRRQFDGP